MSATDADPWSDLLTPAALGLTAPDRFGESAPRDHRYEDFHGGDGVSEPRERGAVCSCGLELYYWQQHYFEDDERDPHRTYLDHLLAVAAEDTESATAEARRLLGEARESHEAEDDEDAPEGTCSACRDVRDWSPERGCLVRSVLTDVESGAPLAWVRRRVAGASS